MANSKISALTSATTPLAGTEVLPIVQSSTTKQVSVANLTAGRAVSASSLTTSAGYTFRCADNTLYEILRFVGGAGKNPGLFGKVVDSTTSAYFGSASSSGADILYVGTSSTSQQTLKMDTAGDTTFLSGNLIQGTAAKGINFTANSAAAGKTSQLLNWYEEGTFTPVVADAATGGNTGTAALAKGRYTRVGRNITVTIAFLDITTTGMTAGNTLYVRALPYASVTDAFVNFIGSQANSQLASTNGAIYPVLGNNSSAIYFLDGIAAGSNNTIKVSGITSGQTDLYITLTYEAA